MGNRGCLRRRLSLAIQLLAELQYRTDVHVTNSVTMLCVWPLQRTTTSGGLLASYTLRLRSLRAVDGRWEITPQGMDFVADWRGALKPVARELITNSLDRPSGDTRGSLPTVRRRR